MLLGLALMTPVVVDFASQSGLGFVSAANRSNKVRAHYLARSAIGVRLAQAPRILALSQSQWRAGTLQDVWAVRAVPFLPLALDGGRASLGIVDEVHEVNIKLLITKWQG